MAHSVTATPQNPSVQLVAPASELVLHEEIEVEVWVNNVTDLNALDIRVSFDPREFEIIDADPATAGVQVIPRADLISPDFIIKRDADNTTGEIWYAVTQLNPTPPASGSGAIFSFKLRPLQLGVGEFEFTNLQLVTREGKALDTVGIPASYYIIGPSGGILFLYIPVTITSGAFIQASQPAPP